MREKVQSIQKKARKERKINIEKVGNIVWYISIYRTRKWKAQNKVEERLCDPHGRRKEVGAMLHLAETKRVGKSYRCILRTLLVRVPKKKFGCLSPPQPPIVSKSLP